MDKQNVLFVLTIDTEEEWSWDDEFPDDNFSVRNVDRLPDFLTFCEGLGVKTTYFVDYAVAANSKAKAVMQDISTSSAVEIGAHLHPWCNPPYYGKTTEFESHVINLPDEQVIAKLDTLTEKLIQEFNVLPRSFRSGRWGIDGRTLKLLESRGYQVDSSVYPFYKNEYFTCEGAPEIPYYPSFENPLQTGNQRNLVEIPVSAGFNRSAFDTANKIHNTLSSPPFCWVKPIGLLWHTHALRKIYLSPELTRTRDMCTLVDACLNKQHPVIHMYLHSSSLIDGATGLLNSNQSYSLICERIARTVKHLQSKANVTFTTITEAARLLQQTGDKEALLTWQNAYE